MKADLVKGTKVCSSVQCIMAGQEQPISNFQKDNSQVDRLNRHCSDCKRRFSKLDRQKYGGKRRSQEAEYRQTPSRKESDRKHYQKHRQELAQKEKLRRPSHREDINRRARDRRQRDPLERVKASLRTRLSQIIRQRSLEKTYKLYQYIGCTFRELQACIEKQFQSGMSWDNYGNGLTKWNIDHIIPLSSAITVEDIYKLCHYTNLQPLWQPDNARKGNRMV